MIDISLVLLKFKVLYLVREVKCQEVLVVNVKEKNLTVFETVFEEDGLKNYFRKVGNAAVTSGKNVANNPEGALEIANIFGLSIAPRNPPKILSSISDLIEFATIGEGIKLHKRAEVYTCVSRKKRIKLY